MCSWTLLWPSASPEHAASPEWPNSEPGCLESNINYNVIIAVTQSHCRRGIGEGSLNLISQLVEHAFAEHPIHLAKQQQMFTINVLSNQYIHHYSFCAHWKLDFCEFFTWVVFIIDRQALRARPVDQIEVDVIQV